MLLMDTSLNIYLFILSSNTCYLFDLNANLQSLVKEFITKDYQASVATVIERALRGDETANYEFPLMTKEGVRIEILLNATARRNPDGRIIGVVGIGQDITGRIAQEREYTRLIDTANAPIFGVDTQCGTFTFVVRSIVTSSLFDTNNISCVFFYQPSIFGISQLFSWSVTVPRK